MKPQIAFKFCPRCANSLVPLKIHNEDDLQCKDCGFHFYINPHPTSSAIIENGKEEVLLVRRKYPPKVGFWDLPGGFVEPNETFEQGVIREVQEELGVKIEPLKLIGNYIDSYEFQGIEYPTINIVFLAKKASGEYRPTDDVDDYRFFAKEKILKQKIAFKSMRKSLEDFFSSTKMFKKCS